MHTPESAVRPSVYESTVVAARLLGQSVASQAGGDPASPRLAELVLSAPENVLAGYVPGQFVMLKPAAWKRADLLWGRPLGIHRVSQAGLHVVVQDIGRGTAELTALTEGEAVLFWGPLGNGFALAPERETLILAGGVGIAPFGGYVDKHPASGKVVCLFGHRGSVHAFPYLHIAERVLSDHFPEDPPGNFEPFVSAMERSLARVGEEGLALACGPMPFLKTVAHLARAAKVPTQLSLETRMACGMGACLGCVAKIRVHDGETEAPEPFAYKQVCTNGPVFWAHDLDLELDPEVQA